MLEEDFNQIWRLLRIYFPSAAAKKESNFKSAWFYAMQPYRKDDVTAAIVNYARNNKYFPDLADITADLPLEQADEEREQESISWMRPYAEKAKDAAAAINEKWRKRGIMTPAEAMAGRYEEWKEAIFLWESRCGRNTTRRSL